MTAAAPLVFPGSRVLAGWWQQLAPVRPQSLWVGYLLLHDVEALTNVSRARRLDQFGRLILQALALGDRGTASAVAERLQLGPQLVRQVLQRLAGEGLARVNGGGHWRPTSLGRDAATQGDYPGLDHERRRFVFVESGRPDRPPHFLSLNDAGCSPWLTGDDWRFDAGLLHACVRKPLEWKQRHGFPLDVEGIVSAGCEGAAPAPEEEPEAGTVLPLPRSLCRPPDWQRVVVDRPQCLLAALVRVPAEGGGDCLVGLPVRADNWVMQADSPAFCLGAEWREVFAELEEEPSDEAWRLAWRAWCQPRRLPPAEVDACVLERQGHRLLLRTTKRFIDRLRAARSDVLRGEAWVLAGSDRIRPAALLELVETEP